MTKNKKPAARPLLVSEVETIQILNKAVEDKIRRLVDKALDAHKDKIELMALAKVMRV
jgi:hypothetical protein